MFFLFHLLRYFSFQFPEGCQELSGARVLEKEKTSNGVHIRGNPPIQPSRNLLSFISEVESLRSKASAADVVFRDPDYFTAGELHQHYEVWEFILEDFRKKDEVLQYIREGVSIFDFIQPFKGQFKGKNYDSPLLHKMMFENNKICNEFDDFISNSTLERVATGHCQYEEKRVNANLLI